MRRKIRIKHGKRKVEGWKTYTTNEELEPSYKLITGIYDTEEIHENCTVQILKNSITGEISVGWWENK